jgi:nicotinamide riboside transporter PnuC
MMQQLERYARSRMVNVSVAAVFAAVCGLGYAFGGGLTFVQQYGGSVAAVIATAFLVWKTLGYWAWMIVNAALWVFLFFHMGLPLLAWLQISFLVFCLYGGLQWSLVRVRIGFNPRVRSDIVGCVIACSVFVYSVIAYSRMPGYTGTSWWALEVITVVTAIAAIWFDAFRYKANWVAWTASNIAGLPLFWHERLWGVFAATFVYQAINVVGYWHWSREERELLAVTA